MVAEAHSLGGSMDQIARFKLWQGLAAVAPYMLLPSRRSSLMPFEARSSGPLQPRVTRSSSHTRYNSHRAPSNRAALNDSIYTKRSPTVSATIAIRPYSTRGFMSANS